MNEAKFTDCKGTVWAIDVSPYESGLVREHCNVELYDFIDPKKGMELIAELETDDAKLVKVLFYLCADQVEEEEIKSIEEFSKRFKPMSEVLNSAFEALLKSLTFFFRRQSEREIITKLIEFRTEVLKQANATAMDALKSIDRSTVEACVHSAMNSLQSQESTPKTIEESGDIHSVNLS